MTITKKAEKYDAMFEAHKRDGEDKEIILFKDNASKKLKDSVYAAHGDRLPDDWIFDTYESILARIGEYDIEDADKLLDYRSEIVDGLVDVYTSDLTAWLASNINNVSYIDDAIREFGPAEDAFKLLSLAQYMAIDEIFSHVERLLTN